MTVTLKVHDTCPPGLSQALGSTLLVLVPFQKDTLLRSCGVDSVASAVGNSLGCGPAPCFCPSFQVCLSLCLFLFPAVLFPLLLWTELHGAQAGVGSRGSCGSGWLQAGTALCGSQDVGLSEGNVSTGTGREPEGDGATCTGCSSKSWVGGATRGRRGQPHRRQDRVGA